MWPPTLPCGVFLSSISLLSPADFVFLAHKMQPQRNGSRNNFSVPRIIFLIHEFSLNFLSTFGLFSNLREMMFLFIFSFSFGRNLYLGQIWELSLQPDCPPPSVGEGSPKHDGSKKDQHHDQVATFNSPATAYHSHALLPKQLFLHPKGRRLGRPPSDGPKEVGEKSSGGTTCPPEDHGSHNPEGFSS